MRKLQLTHEEREAILERIRDDRIQCGGRPPKLDVALVWRDVVATQRLAGIDVKALDIRPGRSYLHLMP